jgi:hypothetical protein
VNFDEKEVTENFALFDTEVSTLGELKRVVNEVIRAATDDVTYQLGIEFMDIEDDITSISDADRETNVFNITLKTDKELSPTQLTNLRKQSFVHGVFASKEDTSNVQLYVTPNYDMVTFFMTKPGDRSNRRIMAFSLGDKNNSPWTGNPDSWNESISNVLNRVINPWVDYTVYSDQIPDGIRSAVASLCHGRAYNPVIGNVSTAQRDAFVATSSTANLIARMLHPHIVKDQKGNLQIRDELVEKFRGLMFTKAFPDNYDNIGSFLRRLTKVYGTTAGEPHFINTKETNIRQASSSNKDILGALNALMKFKLPFESASPTSITESTLQEYEEEEDQEEVQDVQQDIDDKVTVTLTIPLVEPQPQTYTVEM